MRSADQVGVAIEVNSNTIADHLETFVGVHDVGLWVLWNVVSVLKHGELLELLNGCSGTILLSHENWVILLWHLQTKSWVSDDNCNRDEGSHKHDDWGSLVFKMHGAVRIWHFVIKIFILVSDSVIVVFLHVVGDGHGVVDVASSIEILWQIVESNIVPVRWLDFIEWELFVLEVFWDWKMHGFSFEEGHFSFEVLIFTCIIMSILVGHAESGSIKGTLWNNAVAHSLLTECGLES